MEAAAPTHLWVALGGHVPFAVLFAFGLEDGLASLCSFEGWKVVDEDVHPLVVEDHVAGFGDFGDHVRLLPITAAQVDAH